MEQAKRYRRPHLPPPLPYPRRRRPHLPPPLPYPRRRSAIQNKNEGTTSVVAGGIHGRTYYFRRCKKVVASNIESLPNDVLIEILVRLSTDEILEKARFVCWKWYHIIYSDAFLKAHLEYSNSNSNSNWGVLFTSIYIDEPPLFLGVTQGGRIELSKLFYEGLPLLCPVSCNGLAVSHSLPNKTFHLVNLATKQTFSLPSEIPSDKLICKFSMAYVAASMEYKLVRTCWRYLSKQSVSHIITVGIDKDWRSAGVDNLSCEAKMLLRRAPVITPGFMHWTWDWEGTRVLTLNAESEMLTESHVPLLPHPVDDYPYISGIDHLGRKRRRKFYFSTGRRLCLFTPYGDWAYQVWEMEGDSGEWRKLLPNIDLEAQTRRVKEELHRDEYPCRGYLAPLGWLKYPVLLAMLYGGTCIVYNLATDEIDYSFQLPHCWYRYGTVVHKNTLEWLRY